MLKPDLQKLNKLNEYLMIYYIDIKYSNKYVLKDVLNVVLNGHSCQGVMFQRNLVVARRFGRLAQREKQRSTGRNFIHSEKKSSRVRFAFCKSLLRLLFYPHERFLTARRGRQRRRGRR